MSLFDDLGGEDLFGTSEQGFGNAIGELGSGISSLFGAAGSFESADFYKKAAEITAQSTALKEESLTRQGYQAIGQNKEAAATSGFTEGGSAEEAIRSTSEQVGLTKGVVALQGQLQEQAYEAQAKAAEDAGWGGIFGGSMGILGGILGL